jgi:hypothetical protein
MGGHRTHNLQDTFKEVHLPLVKDLNTMNTKARTIKSNDIRKTFEKGLRLALRVGR